MERIYLAVAEGDAQSGFSAWFPDFDGCVTVGETLDEVCANAREALALHIEGMLEDGAEIPVPSDYLRGLGEEGKATLAIGAEVPTRSKRYNITLPEDLVRRIDAKSRNRSGFLAEAAREKLARL